MNEDDLRLFQAEVDASNKLLAERDAYARDAARYRWLRDHSPNKKLDEDMDNLLAGKEPRDYGNSPLSLREYLTGCALSSIAGYFVTESGWTQKTAELCVAAADAVIAELEKSTSR